MAKVISEKAMAEFLADKRKDVGKIDEDFSVESELANLKGQPIGILCARYWYRGIVHKVGNGALKLINARAVEITGPAAATEPNAEDQIPSDVVISLDAIEQFCQPSWCWHQIVPTEEVKE